MSHDTAYGMPFDQVVREYGPLIRTAARKVLRSDADVDDAVQETSIKLFLNHGCYDPNLRLAPWIYAIAVNTAKDVQRKRRRWEVSLENVADPLVPSPEKRYQAGKDLEILMAALTGPQREVLELTGLEGLTEMETAALLGVPLGTIKTRIRRAKIRMRELYSN